MADNTKYAHALLNNYKVMYEEKYGKTPVLNKYKEKWAMSDVVDSVGYERSLDLLEYYFKTTRPGHPLQWFYYNFERLDEVMKATAEDNIRREKIRQQTKAMVERESNEHRVSSN
jgi:hypothetical protein